jgi:hypothetical protein
LVGMEQIGQAVSSINAAAAQSVSGTRQVEEEIAKLQDLAQDLRRITGSRTAAVV